MENAHAPELIAFYGTECPHCVRMEPVIAAVEKELGVTFTKLETWHNEENAARMRTEAGDAIRQACGGMLGVPAFYHTGTKQALCGEQDHDTLRAWASGQ